MCISDIFVLNIDSRLMQRTEVEKMYQFLIQERPEVYDHAIGEITDV